MALIGAFELQRAFNKALMGTFGALYWVCIPYTLYCLPVDPHWPGTSVSQSQKSLVMKPLSTSLCILSVLLSCILAAEVSLAP